MDLDGECSAYWCSLVPKLKKEYNPINYDITFPFNKVNRNDDVYIVDFSISPEEMDKLLGITPRVTWIDHHKSAIEKYNGYKREIRGVRHQNNIAGCALTYIYLTQMTKYGEGPIKEFDKSMYKEVPYFTQLVSDWDSWTFDHGNNSRWFTLGSQTEDTKPTSHFWHDLSFGGYDATSKIIERGKVIEKYRDNWAAGYIKGYGFETDFEGLNCFALNLGKSNSDYFKSVGGIKNYDILISFAFNGDKYMVSLYSDEKKTDVSKIAQKYGGGGHQGASGFTCTELPFKKKEK
jgi:oligoribonuclease NrnB/cAMP/cGMP phosphodiesterase (DHH superfamily)